MTRRLTVALASVAVLLGVVACSGEAAAPATPSSTSSSVAPTPVVIVPGSSAPSSPGTPTPSSVGVLTPSVIDVPTPVAADPWPADLTPEQVADAQAALAAYRAYWAVVDTALADPTQNWNDQVSQFSAGPEKESLLENLQKLADRGQYSAGATETNPRVVRVEAGAMTIEDCVDKSLTDSFNSSGVSVKATDGPGSYFRHPSSVEMAQLSDGRWVVVLTSDDWSQTC
jgi:hypothetical protein